MPFSFAACIEPRAIRSSNETTSARIKTVTVPGDKQGVKGTAYQIDDGDAIEMYSYTNRTSAYGVYPSVLATGNSINYELYSMKITYTKKVDVTKQVEQFEKKYPTAVSIKSVADITESNAATAASETEKAIKEFNSFDADMQNILVSSGAYSEDNYKKYYSLIVFTSSCTLSVFSQATESSSLPI